MAQRLAPVRPVSPVGAARTVRAVCADFFDLAQRTKAARSVFCVGPTATPIRFCRIGNRREPLLFFRRPGRPTPILRIGNLADYWRGRQALSLREL